jgi:predicted DNA-binding protein
MKLHYKNRNIVIDKKKTINFSSEMIEKINKISKAEHITFAKFVRNAIEFYIKNTM